MINEDGLTTDQEVDPNEADTSDQGGEATGTEEEEESEDPSDETKDDDSYELSSGYRVYDEDKEFPDDIKEMITDEKSEKRFRELCTKADSFEPLKEKYQKKQAKIGELEGAVGDLREKFSTLSHYRENDLDAFFESVGIAESELLDYVKQRLRLSEDEDAFEAHKDLTDTKRKAYQGKREADKLRYENEELRRAGDKRSLDEALNSPEISSFKERFDSQLGKGAFVEHAKDYAMGVAASKNIRVKPLDAMVHVMDKYKNLVPKENINDSKKVISKKDGLPNLGRGKPVVPSKPKVSSLDDIDKRIAELKAQGR